MSIPDTITSIENHLIADYEGLENIYGEITGINKNIQNIRTILDIIYNDMPKVTGEGTEVVLTPTRKGRLALIPKGNSTQESTTGRNKLPISTGTSTSSVGIEFKNNGDGSYSYKGKATSSNVFVLPLPTITLQPGTYYVHLRNNATANVALQLRQSGTNKIGVDVNLVNKIYQRVITEAITINEICIYSPAAAVGIDVDITFTPTIELTGDTTDYEIYTRWNTSTKSFIPFSY